MSMLEGSRVDDRLYLRIPHDQVGIAADGDCALRGEAGKPRRTFGQPYRHALDRNASLGGTGPDNRQSELQRSDAAPRAHEVAVVEVLQARRRRRMIGGDQVDFACGQRRPQTLAIVPRSNGRRTFERRGAIDDVLGGERQVMRAGLDGQRSTGGPR